MWSLKTYRFLFRTIVKSTFCHMCVLTTGTLRGFFLIRFSRTDMPQKNTMRGTQKKVVLKIFWVTDQKLEVKTKFILRKKVKQNLIFGSVYQLRYSPRWWRIISAVGFSWKPSLSPNFKNLPWRILFFEGSLQSNFLLLIRVQGFWIF